MRQKANFTEFLAGDDMLTHQFTHQPPWLGAVGDRIEEGEGLLQLLLLLRDEGADSRPFGLTP
jgi:hypothetical protein